MCDYYGEHEKAVVWFSSLANPATSVRLAHILSSHRFHCMVVGGQAINRAVEKAELSCGSSIKPNSFTTPDESIALCHSRLHMTFIDSLQSTPSSTHQGNKG
jgi:hypothetical protein